MQAAHSAAEPVAAKQNTLSPHGAEDAFAAWRRGERLRTVEAMIGSLKGKFGTATDVSHLTDVASFDVHERTQPAVGAAKASAADRGGSQQRPADPSPGSESRRARLLRLRARIPDDYEALLERYRVVGPSPIPASVLEYLRREGGPQQHAPISVANDTVAGISFGALSPSTRVPPSRADAVAVAQAMTVMHRWVDRSYEEGAAGGERRARGSPVLPASERAFLHTLRASVEHNEVFSRIRGTSAERHERLDSLYSEDDRRTLEHLAVVDMGFGEIIRQVMTHCEERGAVLNLIREALFGYLGDFLTTESEREALLARQEEQVRLSQAQFTATKDALDDARRQIASLETEIRRLETLHRYTTAKHLRDKQRLHKKHQQIHQTSPLKKKRRDSSSTAGDPGDDDADSGVFGRSNDSAASSDSSGSDSDEGGDSLAALIKMKRMQEPKARRESMARPIVVPSQFSQVRDRQRVRAAEKVDAEAQTDHAVLYRREPAPPPQPAPLVSDEAFGRTSAGGGGAAPRRRDRTASVLLAKRDVSHSYCQTDAIPALGPLAWGSDGASAAPNDPSLQRRSSIVFTSAALQARGSVADPRRRIESLVNRAKRKENWANMEVQATVPMRHVGVQQGGAHGTERGTQTSVLLQMHLGGAMQQTALGASQHLAAPPATQAPRSPTPSAGGDNLSGTRSPARESTSPSSVGASSFLVKAGSEQQGAPLGSSLHHAEEVAFAYQALVPRQDSSTQTAAQDAAPSAVLGDANLSASSASPQSRASPAAAKGGAAATKRLAALVQPLQPVDLLSVASAFTPGSHVSPTTTSAAKSPQSTAFGVTATPLPPAPKLRNLKWLASTAMEVNFVAVRERFSTSTDVTTLLSKAFRAKYGMEKIADGYMADLAFSLKVWLGTATADSGGGATTPNLQAQLPPPEAAFMGTYRLARDDGTEWTARLHRRLYALIQFLGLQRSVDVPVDAQFHSKAYMFYLYFLDCVRSRAPKPTLKELNDEISTRLPPRLALQTVEAALANRLSVEFLELFLLGVQGAMLHVQQIADARGVVSREDLEMYFPSSHPTCQAGGARVIPSLELLSDAHALRRVPGSFVSVPPDHVWDLDTLLEVLVLAYDKHVHTLVRESHRLALAADMTAEWDVGFQSHP